MENISENDDDKTLKNEELERFILNGKDTNQEGEQDICIDTNKKSIVIEDYVDSKTLDSGWAWMVMFASFGVWASVTMLFNTSGIVFKAIIDQHDESAFLSALPGTILTALSCFAAPLGSAVIDRYSCRVAIILGGFMTTAGTFLTAFAPNIEVVILSLGVVSGVGAALCYTGCNVVLSFNFRQRLNFSLGICSTGAGLSLFVFAPLLQLSRDHYGTPGMFITMAAVCSQIIVFGTLCFPSELEIHCQKVRTRKAQTITSHKRDFRVIKLYLNVLFNRHILGLSASTCCYYLYVYTVFLLVPPFVVSKGLSDIEAAYIMSLIGITLVVGRLLIGILGNTDCVGECALYASSMMIVSAATCVYVFVSKHVFSHFAFAGIYGLLFGISITLLTSVTRQFIEMDFISAAVGIQLFFSGFGTLFGPSFSGYILDAGGSHEQCLLGAGGIGTFAAVLSFVTIYCCKRKAVTNTDSRQQDEILV